MTPRICGSNPNFSGIWSVRIADPGARRALLLVFRGVAFRKQGFLDAAHKAFKEALRSRSPDATIRHHALFERAANYFAQGKKGMARKDPERILAEDSGFEGVRSIPARGHDQ